MVGSKVGCLRGKRLIVRVYIPFARGERLLCQEVMRMCSSLARETVADRCMGAMGQLTGSHRWLIRGALGGDLPD